MTVTGTATKVVRRKTDHGSMYVSVTVDGRSRFTYLHGWEPVPKRGDKITLEGMPLVGYKLANVGAVQVTIHDSAVTS